MEGIEVPRYWLLMGNDALRMVMGRSYPAVERIYGDLYLTTIHGKETLLLPVPRFPGKKPR